MKNKFIILLAVCIIACLPAFAQLRADDENNVHQQISPEENEEAKFRYNGHDYSMGLALGSTKMYANLPISNPQPAYIGYLDKNLLPFLSIGLQVTVGDLSSRWPKNHLFSFNHFTSLDEHLAISLGGIFYVYDRNYNDNIIKRIVGGIYGGLGIGVINNDIKRIANVNWDQLPYNNLKDNPVIEKNTLALYFPFTAGYNYRVRQFLFFHNGFVFNGSIQLNDCQSDYIDGYSPPFVGHKHTGVYSIMTIGAKFYITRKEPDNLFFDQ